MDLLFRFADKYKEVELRSAISLRNWNEPITPFSERRELTLHYKGVSLPEALDSECEKQQKQYDAGEKKPSCVKTHPRLAHQSIYGNVTSVKRP